MRYFASMLVENKLGQYLVLHKIHKREQPWRMPGGKVEQCESPLNCALRELREETGLLSQRCSTRFLGLKYECMDGEDWQGFIFHCQEWSGTPQLLEPEKDDQFGWLSPHMLKTIGADLAYQATVLARLTPTQVRILNLMLKFRDTDTMTNEQLAARVGMAYTTWVNELHHVYVIAGLSGVRGRSRSRAHAADWWLQFRSGFSQLNGDQDRKIIT